MTANLLEARLALPAGAHPPDPWDEAGGVLLPLDSVIVRDASGSPQSRIGDFIWKWEHYTTRGQTSNLNFIFWNSKPNRKILENEFIPQRLVIVRELQYLMALRVYRSNTPLGYEALKCDLFALRRFASFAYRRGHSMRDLLESSSLLDALILEIPDSKCKDLLRWFNFLTDLNPVHHLGFDLAMPKKLAELKRRANSYKNSYLQTAPLPTRIYLNFINSLSNELDEIEAHQERLLSALREALILHREYSAKEATGLIVSFDFGPGLIKKYGLADFLISKGLEADLPGITGALTNIYRICKLQVHTFSGMRDEEAGNLPYHCMETVKTRHGRTHSLIAGVTTKLVGARRKRTRWVTTEAQGFRAIRITQAFAKVIYEAIEVTPSSTERTKDDFPLFIATGYLPWTGNQKVTSGSRYLPATALSAHSLSNALKQSLYPVIEEGDLQELNAIDPFRDWSNESDFAIGKHWNLKSHQLRRSLALYANASGLVQTSSLKRQLQHITREMTEYYGRGSVFAKNFLRDDPIEYKKHICKDWQSSEHEAQYLAFTRDVLDSEEPLCGPGGLFYDLQKQRGEVMSPKEVNDQLKMGRLSYKTHPLGGCTHVGACDKQKGLRLTSGICISENCKSLIGKHSSIIKIIPIQRGIVASLDPHSIAAQIEQEELDILIMAESAWQSPKRPSSSSQGN